MLLFAIDTSGKHGSIAIAECGPGKECRVIEVVALAGGTFSAQLVPQIMELLAKHRFYKNDVGAFAAAAGPGSFTGLRVGLAAIKALSEILQKPVAMVSLLAAVAAQSEAVGKVLAALDAGRNEIYVGEYAGGELIGSEQLLAQKELPMVANDHMVVTPDKTVVDLARAAGLKAEEVSRPRSDVVARVGWKKIQAGDIVTAEELDANYIRRSDAEIFSKT